MRGCNVIVIGAGVVGITTALALQDRGHAVTVIDRKAVAAEASAANAGAMAFSDIEPLATPGIIRKAPKWLLDPLGPLSMPPAYAPRMAPWLLRFWRASTRSRHASGTAAQSALMDLSRTAFEDLVPRVDGSDHLRREGQLQLYEGEARFRDSLPGWDLRRRHGVRFDLLESPEAIARIQPGLDPRFTHAGFTPEWINLRDPKLWVDHLFRHFQEAGGRFERAEVTGISASGDGLVSVEAGSTRHADHAVICAGAWSHRLTRMLGDPVPLETERGYNTTLPAGAFDLRTHLTFPDHGFVVTRIGDGVRVGGAVELAGLRRPPNYARARILLDKAKRFMPDLDIGGGEQWMGFRPSLPDSLPVIGTATRSRRVTYAFGHGHLGLTQAAGTARLVAELVAGSELSLDLAPYRADRFRGIL